MDSNKKIVIIGASSSIAEHCARLWVADQVVNLCLVGRNVNRIERIASDLQVRSPSSQISVLRTDFLDQRGIQNTVDMIFEAGRVDIALIAHGSLPDQPSCQSNLSSCSEALQVNGVSPVLFAEAIVRYMARANHGTLAIIGSVAGDRGRKSNYIYGSAKALIACYAQGLQHRFANSGVKVVVIKPGPTDTPMTSIFKDKGAKMASPLSVANAIVDGINEGKHEIYAPFRWKWIMLIIIHLPKLLFNRMDI